VPDFQRATVELGSVEFRNGGLRLFLGCHFDKEEATKPACFPVRDHPD